MGKPAQAAIEGVQEGNLARNHAPILVITTVLRGIGTTPSVPRPSRRCTLPRRGDRAQTWPACMKRTPLHLVAKRSSFSETGRTRKQAAQCLTNSWSLVTIEFTETMLRVSQNPSGVVKKAVYVT
jgi:hypothetical protein